ncbi:MAG: 1-acyl-sn-glycerol-3-phosphate acyltransferase [Acidobacteriota bacterium]|jgi:1-acyl-sn-glycerol-3-phosphate acyltransferase|nr:1-acyl-sn-glycerol-3-phosphate acyltransferase [Acidobacteriota bacterium]
MTKCLNQSSLPATGVAPQPETSDVPAADPENAPRTASPRRPTVFNYIHSLIAIPLIYLYTFVMGSISLLLSLYDPAGRKQHWCARTWCRMIAGTAGARVHVYGAHNVKPGTSYVFLSTHQSYMDIPAMLGYLPAQLRIAAKKSLFRIPFMGWHLTRAGHIPIDRSSTQNAIVSMQRAANYLRDGICGFIFPEGTRSRDGYLHNFKKGGFKLAVQAGVPIIPITIIGSRQLLPPDEIIFRPGRIDMYIDSPIETTGLTDEDLPALMDSVYDRMAKHFRAGKS